MIKYLVHENILYRSKVVRKLFNHITETNAHTYVYIYLLSFFYRLKPNMKDISGYYKQVFCIITLS